MVGANRHTGDYAVCVHRNTVSANQSVGNLPEWKISSHAWRCRPAAQRFYAETSYKNVLNNGYLFTAYRNTLVIVITGTALNIALTTLTAYPLSKRRLRGRTYITFFWRSPCGLAAA